MTGKPREIEIWFALAGFTLYMLSGGRDRSDWVKNIRKNSMVFVRVGQQRRAGVARLLEAGDEDQLARKMVVEKYRQRGEDDLDEWGKTALVVAVELQGPASRG